MSLLLPCSSYYLHFYSCTFHKWLRLFFLKQSSGYIRTQFFFLNDFFSVSTELYFSAVSIPALKGIFNMLSNVFPILCYTKDNAPIPSILCLSAISSPEMSHPSSPLPLRIRSMSKRLISMPTCHASSSHSLPMWRLSFFF